MPGGDIEGVISSRGFLGHNFLSYRNGIVRAILSHGEEVKYEELPEGALV
jgi:hypothetical protein